MARDENIEAGEQEKQRRLKRKEESHRRELEEVERKRKVIKGEIRVAKIKHEKRRRAAREACEEVLRKIDDDMRSRRPARAEYTMSVGVEDTKEDTELLEKSDTVMEK